MGYHTPMYYAPYPTLSNLRTPSLGQALPTEAEVQEFYDNVAAKLGVTLPPRPLGLSRDAAAVWNVLVAIEISGAQLQQIFARLLRMLHHGSAPCNDLLNYNSAAMRVYEQQLEIVRALRGRPGIPLAPPFPPLFLGFGTNRSAPGDPSWMIDCKARIVGLAPSDGSRGVRITHQNPACTPPEGLGVVFTASVVLGIAAIVAAAGALAYIGAAAADMGARAVEASEESFRVVKGLEGLEWMTKRKEEIAELCWKRGTPYDECMQLADGMVADDLIPDVIEAAKKDRPRKRHWLWWAGVGSLVAGVTIAGVMIYQRKKGKAAVS